METPQHFTPCGVILPCLEDPKFALSRTVLYIEILPAVLADRGLVVRVCEFPDLTPLGQVMSVSHIACTSPQPKGTPRMGVTPSRFSAKHLRYMGIVVLEPLS